MAPHQRAIAALNIMAGEQLAQTYVGGIMLGRHYQPGRILVQAVHDAGPAHPTHAREAIATMGQQGINKRMIGIARCGMDHKTGGFIEHDQMFVLVDNIQIHGLGLGCGVYGRGYIEGNRLAGFDPVRGLGYRPSIGCLLDRYMTGFDQGFNAHA